MSYEIVDPKFFYTEEFTASMEYYGVPETYWKQIGDYLATGKDMCKFLDAIVANDLVAAFDYDPNKQAPNAYKSLFAMSCFAKELFPKLAGGAWEEIKDWKEMGGYTGMSAAIAKAQTQQPKQGEDVQDDDQKIYVLVSTGNLPGHGESLPFVSLAQIEGYSTDTPHPAFVDKSDAMDYLAQKALTGRFIPYEITIV